MPNVKQMNIGQLNTEEIDVEGEELNYGGKREYSITEVVIISAKETLQIVKAKPRDTIL